MSVIDQTSSRSAAEVPLADAGRTGYAPTKVESGETPDDFVNPAHLGPIARLGLKEAFRIVGGEQQMLATDLGVDL